MYLSINWKDLPRDGRFWIAFFAILRLYAITDPPLEVVHNWRQTTVAMVARNFYESSPELLYPRLDIDGGGTGIEGMEFPALNYGIYLVAQVFGYDHWYGRLINLIVSSLGILCFYLLLKKYAGNRLAIMAVIILEVSMWFVYMRKMMPDTFSVSLVISGIYFATGYLLERKSALWLMLSALLIALGTLSKIPAACVLPVLLLPFLQAEIKRKLIFAGIAIIALIPACWWYFIWVPYLNSNYGTGHFFMGQSFSQGWHTIIYEPGNLVYYFCTSALKYVGFTMMLFGIGMSFVRKKYTWLIIFMVCLVPFCVFLVKGGSNSLHHDYYFIPFVPLMALMAAYGLSEIKNQRVALLLLLVISVEGILNQYHDFRIKPGEATMLSLESKLDGIMQRDAVIAVNSPFVPTPMYFAHRKGWLCSKENLYSVSYIDELKSHGLNYIVVMRDLYEGDLQLPYAEVYNDELIRVYQP